MWVEKIIVKRKLSSSRTADRLEAVAVLQEVQDRLKLLELAQNDAAPAVRQAAALKLSDDRMLEDLYGLEQDPEVQFQLRARLDQLYAQEALSACAEGRECDAFDRISDLAILMQVALQSGSQNLSLAAGARLSAIPERWQNFLEQIANDSIALELYSRNRPEPDSALEDYLALHAKSRALREAIAENRAQRQAALAIHAEELALVEAVERCAEQPDPAVFEELALRWAAMDSRNERLKERFLAAKYRYHQALEQKLVQQEAFARTHQLAQELYQALTTLPEEGAEKNLRAILAAWQNAKLDTEPGAEEFRSEFQMLAARCMERLHLQQERETQVLAEVRTIRAAFAAMQEKLLHEKTLPDWGVRNQLLEHLAQLEQSLPGTLPMDFVDLKEQILKSEREFRLAARTEAQARDLERWEHYTIKMDLCTELEHLAAVPEAELPQAAGQFRKIRERWESTGTVPREKVEELRSRYWQSCKALHSRLERFFNERDTARKQSEVQKTAICSEAETLANSEDWERTSARLKELQSAWKSIGSAAPGVERELFQRFHNACDVFFVRRNQYWEKRKKGFEEAAAQKRELINAVTALKSKPFYLAKKEIPALRDAWRQIPSSGRDDRLLYVEFNRILDEIFAAHREAGDEARRQSEIICTNLLEIAEKAQNGAMDLDTLEKNILENKRQWEALTQRPSPEAMARRNQAMRKLERYIESMHHQQAVQQLEQARNLENVVEVSSDPAQLVDHLGRRLKVCGELEDRLRECRVTMENSANDLAKDLQMAIAGNFGGSASQLTLRELDDFLRRFIAIGRVPDEARNAVFDRFSTLYNRALQLVAENSENGEAEKTVKE